MTTSNAKSYAAQTAASALAPFAIARRQPGPTDVRCMVDSCHTCANCRAGNEQYCLTGGTIWTYNGEDKALGGHTFGGYSTSVVVDESFVLRIPAGLDPAAAAPLLCPGITTWSPLRHWKVGPGQKIGIVGLGGLGHMGVKLARAMGPTSCCLPPPPEKSPTACVSALMKLFFPKTPTR